MVREYALDILLSYFKEGSYLNLTLNQYLSQHDLSRKDKDLLTHLIYGVVQYKLDLEYQMEPLVKGKKIDKLTYVVLMMALYQWNYLDKIPSYAIISSSVELVKKRKGKAKASFVNALLRQYERLGKRDYEGLSTDDYLSITTSHPLWMIKMFKSQYGKENVEKICLANNLKPDLTARYNRLLCKKEDVYSYGFKDGKLAPSSLIYQQGNIALSEAYQKGFVSIQDESSQCVALLLNPQKGERVLDMCAAPGSKTCHMAELMDNVGEIIANDIHEHKMPLIENQAKRLNIEIIRSHCGDARYLHQDFEMGSFDSILLDAPCSGLGVLSRKPEIRYHDSSVMDELIPLQKELLDEAYILLKKGGNLVYSTCTINKKENTHQIKYFLDKYKDMKLIEERQILPSDYGTDGFYMAKMVKGDL